MNKLSQIVFVIGVASISFFYRDQLKNVWMQSFNHYFPCKIAITYKINRFDTRFGISKEDFISTMKEAEAIWEKPVGKDLFRYEEKGILDVNLEYDIRQEATVKLKQMGITLDNNKASYDELRTKYELLTSQYEQKKSSFELRVSAFETRKRIYDEEVSRVNKRGGGNKETVARLNVERDYLNSEVAALNQIQNDLSSDVDNINALVSSMNQMAKISNLNVKQYNTVGDQISGEFDEGIYKSGPDGQEIDIYQFDNKTKLLRVLAHELGHALGLEHVEDAKAIMYRLNNGINEKLTETDLVALKNLCGIK